MNLKHYTDEALDEIPSLPIGSTFYDDLADLIASLVDEAKIQREYLPEVPNAQDYPVDYRIEGKNGTPLFLYGVPNRDKARLTTILLSYFHRHDLRFESILVFENQAEIPRLDLAPTLGRWRRHDLVAGVARGLPSEGHPARGGVVAPFRTSLPLATRSSRTREGRRDGQPF